MDLWGTGPEDCPRGCLRSLAAAPVLHMGCICGSPCLGSPEPLPPGTGDTPSRLSGTGHPATALSPARSPWGQAIRTTGSVGDPSGRSQLKDTSYAGPRRWGQDLGDRCNMHPLGDRAQGMPQDVCNSPGGDCPQVWLNGTVAAGNRACTTAAPSRLVGTGHRQRIRVGLGARLIPGHGHWGQVEDGAAGDRYGPPEARGGQVIAQTVTGGAAIGH
jgi:hypothetical protein